MSLSLYEGSRKRERERERERRESTAPPKKRHRTLCQQSDGCGALGGKREGEGKLWPAPPIFLLSSRSLGRQRRISRDGQRPGEAEGDSAAGLAHVAAAQGGDGGLPEEAKGGQHSRINSTFLSLSPSLPLSLLFFSPPLSHTRTRTHTHTHTPPNAHQTKQKNLCSSLRPLTFSPRAN